MFRRWLILGTLQLTCIISFLFVLQFFGAHQNKFHPWNRIKLLCLIFEHVFAIVMLFVACRYQQIEQFIEWLKQCAHVVLTMSALTELWVMIVYRQGFLKKHITEVGLDPLDRVYLSVWIDFYHEIFVYSLSGVVLFFLFSTGQRIQEESVQRRRNSYVEENLQIMPYNPADNPDNRSCPICLGDYQLQEDIAKTLCNHMFHSKCMMSWLESSNTCPICRQELF